MSNVIKNKGFTLIELMVVVVIIGILVAIAIPNFISMEARAKEAMVRSNCHTLSLAAEDFAVQNIGVYAANHNVDTTPEGDTLIDMLPSGGPLLNPFTRANTEPVAGPAANPGEIGYEVLVDVVGVNVGYTITGFGKTVLTVTIESGS